MPSPVFLCHLRLITLNYARRRYDHQGPGSSLCLPDRPRASESRDHGSASRPFGRVVCRMICASARSVARPAEPHGMQSTTDACERNAKLHPPGRCPMAIQFTQNRSCRCRRQGQSSMKCHCPRSQIQGIGSPASANECRPFHPSLTHHGAARRRQHHCRDHEKQGHSRTGCQPPA